MNTTSSIYKDKPEHKAEQKAHETKTDKAEPPKAKDHVPAQETKTHKAEPKAPPPQAEPRQILAQERVKLEVGQPHSPLSPQAAVAALGGEKPDKSDKPSSEGRDQKVLRVLKTSLGRLTGRGMPELDDEVAALIDELEGKKDKEDK